MGSLYVTADPALAMNCKCYGENYEIIALVDSQYELANYGLDPRVVQVGSIILPSYDAISMYIDGDEKSFDFTYFKQLMFNKECDEFIALIAFAMFQNRNVILFVGEEKDICPYIHTLLNYFYAEYGTSPGVLNDHIGYVHPNYYHIWINKFYTYNFITYDDFLALYPAYIDIHEEILNKLSIDFPPPDEYKASVFSSFATCNQWYCKEILQRQGLLKQLFTIEAKK